MIDKIIRSERRTLSIRIGRTGEVIVRAPLGLPLPLIERFAVKNRAWIAEHQTEIRRRLAENPPHTFTPGDRFYFLGEAYPLEFRTDAAPAVILEGAFITRPAETEEIKRRLRQWYRREAYGYLTERIGIYAGNCHLSCNGLRITSAVRRWGSCTAAGKLNFPWRLMMCPEPVIAYVIAHELAHLRQLNHSPRFWQEVETICPAYRNHRDWLHAHEHRFPGF